MTLTCCVQGCRGNYNGGPKVSVFAFPKDTDLCKKWLLAVRRKNFTASMRVCELHFSAVEIERCTTKFYTADGNVLDVPINRPRLIKNAVPSRLLDCVTSKRQRRIKNNSLKCAPESTDAYATKLGLNNLDDVVTEFNKINSPLWTLIRTPHNVSFVYIKETPNPSVHCMVCVNEDMQLSVCCKNVQIKSLPSPTGYIKFPLTLNKLRCSLGEVLSSTVNFFDNKKVSSSGTSDKCKLLNDILESISDELPEHTKRVRFLQGQIKLLNQ